MSDKIQEALDYINMYGDLIPEKYRNTIVQSLQLLSEVEELSNIAEQFADLDQTGGNIWRPTAVRAGEEEWEWQQELLGTVDEDIAKFLIDTIKTLQKIKALRGE